MKQCKVRRVREKRGVVAAATASWRAHDRYHPPGRKRKTNQSQFGNRRKNREKSSRLAKMTKQAGLHSEKILQDVKGKQKRPEAVSLALGVRGKIRRLRTSFLRRKNTQRQKKKQDMGEGDGATLVGKMRIGFHVNKPKEGRN